MKEGDLFEITRQDGGICLYPVVVYPKEKICEIAQIIKEAEREGGNAKAYDSVSAMLADMGVSVGE